MSSTKVGLKNFFYFTLFYSRVCAMWPIPKESPCWKIALNKVYMVFAFALMSSWITVILIQVTIDIDQLDRVSEGIGVGLITAMMCVKRATLIIKSTEVHLIMDFIENNFSVLIENGQSTKVDIIKQAFNQAKSSTLRYTGVYASTSVFWSLNMFTNVHRYKKSFSTTNNSTIVQTPDGLNMVLNAYYPLDTSIPTNERIVCIHYMCGAMCCALMCASIDAFYFSLMIALRAHFSLLNVTLRDLVDNDSPNDQNQRGNSNKLSGLMKNKMPQISSGLFLKELAQPAENTKNDYALLNVKSEPDARGLTVVDCIEYHQTLLSYAERLRRLFSPSLFFQYVIISINLCFTLYQLSSISVSSFLFLSQSFFLGCLVFQQGLMCWYANEIAVESSEVGMAAYKCPWYDASPKFKFRIQNIMRRSQKPVVITAGMFGGLSMWAFTGVLQTSYSYFAVLRQSNTR